MWLAGSLGCLDIADDEEDEQTKWNEIVSSIYEMRIAASEHSSTFRE